MRPGEKDLCLLLAEAHWADEVRAPSWGILMRWLSGTVPFVVQRAADAWMRRISRVVDRLVEGRSVVARLPHAPVLLALAAIRAAVNVAALGLALIVVLALLALGLLARFEPVRDACFGNDPKPFPRWMQVLAVLLLVPIWWFASGAGALAIAAAAVVSVFPAVVLLSLATTLRSLVVSFIGDSYALVADADSHAAIVARVQRDLRLLEQLADRAAVIIVAHSQGAEVVQQVLARRAAATPINRLVTFGAGIAKLHAIRQMRAHRRQATGAFALRLLSAICTCAGALAILGAWDAPLEPYFGPALLAIGIALISLARKALIAIVGPESRAIVIGEQQVAHWSDLHASHDPVSEGNLPLQAGFGQSSEVVNRRSLVLDHVTYWHNAEGFQAAVALEIERATSGRGAVQRPAALQRAVKARTRVVDCVFAARAAVIALAVVLWLALKPAFVAGALIVVLSVLLLVALTKAIDAAVARGTAKRVNRHVTEIVRAPVGVA